MVKGRVHRWISQLKKLILTFEPISRIPPQLGSGLILTALLIGSSGFSASTPTLSQPSATEIFDQAVDLRTSLEGKPARSRTLADYKKVIDNYRSVYYTYPGSSKADDALIAVAEVYQLMANDQKEAGYFEQAIKAYKFLVKEYPASRYCTEALYTTGEIYLNDLKDPLRAQEIFIEFISKYPRSSKVRNVKARLDDLRTELKQAKRSTIKPGTAPSKAPGRTEFDSQTTENPAAGRNLVPASTDEKGNTQEPRVFDQELEKLPTSARINKKIQIAGIRTMVHSEPPINGPSGKSANEFGNGIFEPENTSSVKNGARNGSTIGEVRYWNTEEYTRIVIIPDGEVKYLEGRLDNPARIYIDIESAKLSPTLFGKTFAVNDGYLNQIRFGQLKEQISRIVFDIGAMKICHVFNLQDPYRIVVDILGPPRSSLFTEKKEWQVSRGDPLPDELERPSAVSKRLAVEQKKADNQFEVSRTRIEPNSKTPPPPPLKPNQDPQKLKTIPVSPDKTAPLLANQDPQERPKTANPKSDGTRSLTRTLGLKVGRIVIDPGHGGHDTGTVGQSGLQEKDLVLDISMRLKKLIEERLDGEVILTRSEDLFVPLEERTAIANQSQADLFISIHANSSRNKRVSGVETFFLNFASWPEVEEIAARENASSQKTVFELQDLVQKIALKEKVEESREFAHIVQKSMSTRLLRPRTALRDRGVKQAPFIVLIGANMPSILSEISFVSNPSDEKLLKATGYRQKIAEALCEGIASYARNLGGIKTAKILH